MADVPRLDCPTAFRFVAAAYELVDHRIELSDLVSRVRLDADDGWYRSGASGRGQDSAQFRFRARSTRLIGFVDDTDVGCFDDAGFHRLDLIASTRRHYQKLDIHQVTHGEFRLTNTDSFEDDLVEAEIVEYAQDFGQVFGQPIIGAAAGQ